MMAAAGASVGKKENYYDTIASSYNELHKNEQEKKLAIISSLIAPKSKEWMIDVGSGTGFSREFFKCRIVGVDSSKEMLSLDPGKHVNSRAEKLPFKDNSFDYCICVTALHNFDRPSWAINEMARVCKGPAVITVLKKSPKAKKLKAMIEKRFLIEKEIAEDKDDIYLLTRLAAGGLQLAAQRRRAASRRLLAASRE